MNLAFDLQETPTSSSPVDRLHALVDGMLGPREELSQTRNIHEITEHVRQLIEDEAKGGLRSSEIKPKSAGLSRWRAADQAVRSRFGTLASCGEDGRIRSRCVDSYRWRLVAR